MPPEADRATITESLVKFLRYACKKTYKLTDTHIQTSSSKYFTPGLPGRSDTAVK